jgi:hypothetical protein
MTQRIEFPSGEHWDIELSPELVALTQNLLWDREYGVSANIDTLKDSIREYIVEALPESLRHSTVEDWDTVIFQLEDTVAAAHPL